MSSDVALRIQGLGKKYSIRHKDHDHVTMAQAALHRLRHPRGALGREEFWALRDVSFEVPRGQVLGVIGHNGAGKSTLLKILSRITPPTTGRVEVFGRIGSLLEVGTGFHPELTGRENIYLNGSILGMRTKEIDRQFDAIVDFSGVEKFLDTPVKRYSSGMYVRLAFAVAAHLDTEILLMDEVLAVGDAEFQKKCLGKMGDVARSGRTVLFVSHNLGAVRAVCNEVAVVDKGQLRFVGSVEDGLAVHASRRLEVPARQRLDDWPRPPWVLTGNARIQSAMVETIVHDGALQALTMTIGVDNTGELRSTAVVISILTSHSEETIAIADFDDIALETGTNEVRCHIEPLDLRPGDYLVSIALTTLRPRFGFVNHDVAPRCLGLDLSALSSEGAQMPQEWGHVRLRGTASSEVQTRSGAGSHYYAH